MKSVGPMRGNHDLKEQRRRCGRTTMGGEVKTKPAVIPLWGHSWWAGTFALILYLAASTHAFSSRSISSIPNAVAMQARRRRTVREMATSGEAQEEDSSSGTEATVNVRAAVYQPPIALNEASASSSAETNPLQVLTEVAAVLQLAAKCGIDLVQFPELFLPGGGEFVFQTTTNSSLAPLDRTAYALNIVGNLCGELNVACVMGYAEAKHESESESETRPTPHQECYSSLALFHADGSRAGNYRCVHPSLEQKANSIVLVHGHALVEAIPIGLTLPARPNDAAAARQLQVGSLCGGDLWIPEHAKHLARSGAQLLVVSGSLQTNARDEKVAQHVLITRSMENHLPVLFSNYVHDHDDGSEEDPSPPHHERANMAWGGRSAILSSDGTELVRAPASLDGDMPSDEGYFLPCEETGGALYAADLEIASPPKVSTRLEDASMDQWEITPRIDQLGDSEQGGKETTANETGSEPRVPKGFGRQVVEVLEQSKKTKRKQKLRLKK